jgi:hypothetical protein
MTSPPAFYLTAAHEYAPLAEPRACWVKQLLRDRFGRAHLYVELQPSFMSEGRHVSSVVLSNRHRGDSLEQITTWPTYVYVCTLARLAALYETPFDAAAVQVIAWARIYGGYGDAERDRAGLPPNRLDAHAIIRPRRTAQAS